MGCSASVSSKNSVQTIDEKLIAKDDIGVESVRSVKSAKSTKSAKSKRGSIKSTSDDAALLNNNDSCSDHAAGEGEDNTTVVEIVQGDGLEEEAGEDTEAPTVSRRVTACTTVSCSPSTTGKPQYENEYHESLPGSF